MEVKEILNGVVEEYKKLFKEELVSIILYGSASGGEYLKGKSDINLLIILSEEGINRIDSAIQLVRKWKKKRVATPVFLTEQEVQNSLDTFPVEYINFKSSYRVVYGKDILSGLSFDRELVRLQCERELRAKMVVLRSAILDAGIKKEMLKSVLIQSFKAFIAIFRALLYIEGKEIPSHTKEIIKEISSSININEDVFFRLLDLKDERIKLKDKEIISLSKDYVREVKSLVRLIDSMGG